MREQLFQSICDRLNAEVPELRWIDQDWNQIELPDQSYPLQFDAALISFPEIPWRSATRGVQDGDVQIRVRIVIDMYNDTHIADGVTAPDRAMALSKLGIVSKVHAALQDWEGDFFGKLSRVRSTEEMRNDGLKCFNEYYVCAAKETVNTYTQTDAAPNVTGSIQINV